LGAFLSVFEVGLISRSEQREQAIRGGAYHHRYPHHLNLYLYLSYLIYPIRGGAIIGGIYDIGLKGLLGVYIGLLLNAPYKIDR
jgi:hypothetical protein